jgi:hypothetical protein
VTAEILNEKKRYLANLLEAIQRCVYFLEASDRRVTWPLDGDILESRKKDDSLFGSLAAIKERFAKLQDTLSAAMRHSYLLLGETGQGFLRVLMFFEKQGVIDSVESWQLTRTARNLAAHDYETQYTEIAKHFNALHELRWTLFRTSDRLITLCKTDLEILPAAATYSTEFSEVLRQLK